VIGIDGPDLDAFVTAAREALGGQDSQTMLTNGIADAYRQGRDRIAGTAGVDTLLSADSAGRSGAPAVFVVSAEDFLNQPSLAEEVFGPVGLVVKAKDEDALRALARSFHGQLTATLQMEDADAKLAETLLPILERRAGRLLANGFPTGVEVADAMVHGGPYPASTNFGATSVGTMAIRRWLRPVCYQNLPSALTPA